MSKVLLEVLSDEDIRQIHNTSLQLLQEVGIEVEYEPAVEVLKEAGMKVEGGRVYFDPGYVEKKIAEAPRDFTLHARDPKHNVHIGGDDVVYVPGYGAPFVIEAGGNRRPSTWEDYLNLLKLAHVCEEMDLSGGMLVEPNDLDDRTRYLDALYAHIRYSTKCLMGSSYGADGARDTIELLAPVFGGKDAIKEKPVVITLINTISPLKLDARQTGALMEYAKWKQAMVIASLVMAGSTGPVTLAGALAVQNAEVLAGITLAQTINPGTPVVYGSASSITDMRTGSVSIANAEAALLTAATAQLARYYGIPCRAGGGLTDSKAVDGQAGYESALMLLSPVAAGVNFILHTAGILQYWLCMSYEKFVMDAEIAGMIKRFKKSIDVNENTLAFDVIKKVGPGGHFLTQIHTKRSHKTEIRKPLLSDRQSYEGWSKEKLTTEQRANRVWKQMLTAYEDPGLDEALQKELQDYIGARKKEITK
ncbi:MAG: glycine betaine---corrinoid protein Co-methyltransferase [Clostridia bacterium]|nr:glycine betaine---corrinoid protein Co-methyltransferase [Clostridia bacterium]MDN5365479.1 glycine betaine---corrinoid protein Co-methyltransferase [Thermacetogenium sp.]MDN5375007.1 glycine betaine---corrinoid protein Co-methyltransferase [Thermacetogenium sp.]